MLDFANLTGGFFSVCVIILFGVLVNYQINKIKKNMDDKKPVDLKKAKEIITTRNILYGISLIPIIPYFVRFSLRR